jgi:hypothetical protein
MVRTIGHSIVLNLAFLLYFLAVVLVANAAWAQPGPPPSDVEIVNTPDVNVVNTPDVHVTNTPSVDVTSLPAVTIAPGATFRDRDNPAIQPLQFTCEIYLADGDQIEDVTCVDQASLTGKTLVIEYINATVGLPTGQNPEMRLRVTSPNQFGSPTAIERRYQFEECGLFSPTNACFWLDQRVRLYHTDFNLIVTFGRSTPHSGDVTFQAHFSGYLVDN